MKVRHALWILGAIFSICIVIFLLSHESAAAAPAATNAGVAGTDSRARVVAYYFHVTVRCKTCRTIEAYSKEAIEKGFPAELENGAVEWKPVNVQLSENRHYIQDYRLFTRSLVLVKLRDGKQVGWRNLERVWELVGNKPEFEKYVQANVRDCL